MSDGVEKNEFQVDRALTGDVVVVGAGPAGIAAACAAAERGKRVVLVDNNPWPGGQIWKAPPAGEIPPLAASWRRRLEACGAEVLGRATVFAALERNRLLAASPDGGIVLTGEKIILATGARELALPFPGWTLPGVLAPGGLESLAKSGWPVRGKRVVVAGSGPLLLAAASGLKRHGATIVAMAEQAPWTRLLRFGLTLTRRPGKLLEGLAIQRRLWATPYRCGWWPVRAEGDGRVEAVVLTDGRRRRTLPCDYLACGFGLVPNVELAQLLGCRLRAGLVEVDGCQETTVRHVFCAGEPTGIGGMDCALVEGQIAGLCAAGYTGEARRLFRRREGWHRFRENLATAFVLRDELRGLAAADTVVCRCEDVRRDALEGCAGFRAAKLQTRCGMGACQGRTCGAATRFLWGWENDSHRPPILPVRLAALALGEPAPAARASERADLPAPAQPVVRNRPGRKLPEDFNERKTV